MPSPPTAPPFAAGFDLDELDAEQSSIAILDRSTKIVWVNDAWTRFARENGARGGTELGAHYLAGITAPELKEHFERVFEGVLTSGKPYQQQYDCPSPDLARRYHMRILPLERSGFLVEHSLMEARAAGGGNVAPDEATYRNEHGIVVQCSNCRRVRANDGAWHWIRAWVADIPERTSHGLCATCARYYWP